MQGTLAFIGPRETKALGQTLGQTGHVLKQPVSHGCQAVLWSRMNAGSKEGTRVTIKASRQAGTWAGRQAGVFGHAFGVQERKRSRRHPGKQAVIGGKASWCAGEHVAWTAVHRRQKGMHAGTMSVWMAGRQARKLARPCTQAGRRQTGRQTSKRAGTQVRKQAGRRAHAGSQAGRWVVKREGGHACSKAGRRAGRQAGRQARTQAGRRRADRQAGRQAGSSSTQAGKQVGRQL
jgi:hypothetical protein